MKVIREVKFEISEEEVNALKTVNEMLNKFNGIDRQYIDIYIDSTDFIDNMEVFINHILLNRIDKEN